MFVLWPHGGAPGAGKQAARPGRRAHGAVPTACGSLLQLKVILEFVTRRCLLTLVLGAPACS